MKPNPKELAQSTALMIDLIFLFQVQFVFRKSDCSEISY